MQQPTTTDGLWAAVLGIVAALGWAAWKVLDTLFIRRQPKEGKLRDLNEIEIKRIVDLCVAQHTIECPNMQRVERQLEALMQSVGNVHRRLDQVLPKRGRQDAGNDE